MEKRIGELDALSAAAKAAALGATYEQFFPSGLREGLDSLDTASIEYLFRASEMVSGYTLRPAYAKDMLTFLRALERKGAATLSHYASTRDRLIMVRMLDEATEFTHAHANLGLAPLPLFREDTELDPTKPSEWVVSRDGRELVRKNVVWNGSFQILVVSHPLCHFSVAAALAIHADPVLRPIFAEHAKWVAPQERKLTVDILQEWNRTHVDQEMSIVHMRDEWPVPSWATPTFYVMREGRIVATVEGWPKQGRRDELIGALHRAGIPLDGLSQP